MNIKVFDRYRKVFFKELVYGEKSLQFLYKTSMGQFLSKLISHPYISKLYGLYQSHPISAHKIEHFLKDFSISLDEFEKECETPPYYKTFNQFFVRQFRPLMRPFSNDLSSFCAFAEGRYLAGNSLLHSKSLTVKSILLSPKDLLGPLLAKSGTDLNIFNDAVFIIARLCPVDYHWFHYPCDAKILYHLSVSGPLESVNPIVFDIHPDVFLTNKRALTLLQLPSGKHIAYVEVGATMVGEIVQTPDIQQNVSVTKGKAKGHFKFGGSTVIVLAEKGAIQLDEDIISLSDQGYETFIKLGDKIGTILL